MLTKIKYIPLYFLFLLFVLAANTGPGNSSLQKDPGLKLMFYNLENLFDTLDSKLDDDEFLPSAARRWNTYKYYRKLNNIFKVVALCNEDMVTPDLIGLCEVENKAVLEDLCRRTYLYRDNYGYLISEGKDQRGISTALLYKKDRLGLISTESWSPLRGDGTYMFTRAVLYSSFHYAGDTLHIMVCHWPSRRGGAIASEYKRKALASFIKRKVDSIGIDKKLIIMGDLNDEPYSESVNKVLAAVSEEDSTKGLQLVNVSSTGKDSKGSYKYQGTWYLFDQFILSSSLFDAPRGLYYRNNSFRIVNDDALSTEDTSYKGVRPYSTWWGYSYSGGFSDHYPVTIKLGRRH
ncbi:MAG: endonuclease [Bacteroidales bacterium]|nr:endonuclease [Bacteroidales bacterium]